MKHTIDINELRNGKVRTDRAIVDLLQLEQLGVIPGVASVALLKALWRISQSQVSRRLTAIASLNTYTIQSGWGRYCFIQPRSHKSKSHAAQRWEQLRKTLQDTIADI